MSLVAGRGYSGLEKHEVSKKYTRTLLYSWDDEGTEIQEKSRKILLKEKRHSENTAKNHFKLRAESDRRIGKERYCGRGKIQKMEDSVDKAFSISLNSLSTVNKLQESKLEKISESDQLFTEDSNRPTEIIMKSLNPMLAVANQKVRKHNELLNRFYKCFDQCFEVDEEYFLSEELEKDYLFPEELLLKPDLDFEKLRELPFDFRTSLVTIRSLLQKMKECRQKCDGQLDVILDVIQREIQVMSLTDKASLYTPYYQELLKELQHMNLLLMEFSGYADYCNAHLEEILMDVILISEDFLV